MSRSQTKRLLALALLLGACGGPSGAGPLALSWRFADGRRCADAGVARVVLDLAGEPGFACAAGLEPLAITLEAAPRGGVITARALSPQDVELYRGEVALDPTLEPTTVTLYATGSR